MRRWVHWLGLAGLLALFLVSTQLVWANSSEYYEDDEAITNCKAAREFITAHRYLSEKKALGLDEKQIRRLSHKVSQGCTGAARRFIYSLEMLLKAEAAPRGAMRAAVQLSQEDEDYARAFVGVFKRAYMAKYMDLDFSTSFRLAESLSLNYEGDVRYALRDFMALVDFCMDADRLDLPKPQCGIIAGRISKLAEKFEMPISKSFIKAYDFIQSKKGLQIPVIDALNMAESIVSVSPNAVENFIFAFRYGVSNKGLAMTHLEALGFAQDMTNRTVFRPDPAFKVNYERLPASLKKTK